MNVFLNSNNGVISLTLEPLPNATLIPVEDVFASAKKKYQEFVSAEVHQDLIFHKDLRIATFNGLSPTTKNEFGVEYCQEHEAHNLDSIEEARAVWVHCRIGSLEDIRKRAHTDTRVHCRIGSLEVLTVD